MNQFENQCVRKINGVRCQKTHIKGYYHCEDCIAEVQENKNNQTVRCNRDVKMDGGRYKCRNQRSRNEKMCDACRNQIDNKNRYYVCRFNKDLIIDLQR